MSLSGWMAKLTVVGPHHGTLLSSKKEQMMHNHLEDSQELCRGRKSQFQKLTCCMIAVICHSWNDRIIEMKNRLVVARSWKGTGGREDGGLWNGAMKDPSGGRKVLHLDLVKGNMLPVILYGSFASSYPWGDGKGHLGSLHFISYLAAHEPTIISKRKG